MLDHTDILEANQGTLLGDLWIDDAPGYVLMQFTGLKDKFNRPIFEGDIVKGLTTSNRSEVIGDVRWKANTAGFVIYMPNEFHASKLITASLDRSHTRLEVIGNIYENKELLK